MRGGAAAALVACTLAGAMLGLQATALVAGSVSYIDPGGMLGPQAACGLACS